MIGVILIKIQYEMSTEPWSSPYHFQTADVSKIMVESVQGTFQDGVKYILKMEKLFPSFHVNYGLGYTYDEMCLGMIKQLMKE